MNKKRTPQTSPGGGYRGEAGAKNKQQENITFAPVKCQSNSTSNQRYKILQWLKSRPLTTLQARHELDIMHPGMRVCELRKAGHQIATLWATAATPEGNLHRVGQYMLLPEKQLSLLDLVEGGA